MYFFDSLLSAISTLFDESVSKCGIHYNQSVGKTQYSSGSVISPGSQFNVGSYVSDRLELKKY
jgi:hypothetical protein